VVELAPRTEAARVERSTMEEYMVIEVIGEHTRCGGGREVERWRGRRSKQ
jgi:hypothetical protein